MHVRRSVSWLLLGALAVTPAVSSGQTPAPPDSLDAIPSAKREDVTRLLHKVRRRHGEDAVVIQTHLLLNAMQKGSVLATGVRVDRVEQVRDKRYLVFDLETGVVFDDLTRDQAARLQILWATILEPTLERLKDGLQVNEADGIMVRMQYHHRPYRTVAELRENIDQPGTAEEARFGVLATDVDAVVRGEVSLRDLLRRAHVTVDGTERAVDPPPADRVLTPGPE